MLEVSTKDHIEKVSAVVLDIAARHGVTRMIGPADHLVDCGMTSMAMVDLMLAVEAEFYLTIPQDRMTPSNFQSIAALAGMVHAIRCGGG